MKKMKAKFLIERGFYNKECPKMVKEAGEHLKRSAIVWRRIGNDEIVKLSEWKEEGLSNQYVREAAKASNEVHMNIGSLELLLH